MIIQLFHIFSTREIATFIWICILAIYVLWSKNVRHSVIEVIKSLGHKFFIVGLSSLIIYTLFSIFILEKLYCWDITLIKDTSFWFLFTAVSIFFSAHKAKDVVFFMNILKDNLKIIIVFEFIINLYTFPLLIELLLFPIIVFASILQVTTEKNNDQKKVHSCLGRLLSLIGLSMIGFAIYKTIIDHENFFSIPNLKSFSLPIFLTILSLPYFYVLALYMSYESYITIVKHLHRYENPKGVKDFIKATFKYANVNLNTLSRIWKYQSLFNASKDDPFEYVRKVSQKPKYIIGDTAKLKIFNDIQRVIKFLSNNDIGKLDDWHKSYSGDDCYLSMTNYYQFGFGDVTKIPNSLAYYLTGEEMYIKQLDLVLDVGYQQNKTEALTKFIDTIKLTFDSLMTPMPNDITDSILIDENYKKEYDTHTITLSYEKFERIETYQLSIITK